MVGMSHEVKKVFTMKTTTTTKKNKMNTGPNPDVQSNALVIYLFLIHLKHLHIIATILKRFH